MKTKFIYRKKRVVDETGNYSYQKVREYSSEPIPVQSTAVTVVPTVQNKPTVRVRSKGTIAVGAVTLSVNAEPNELYVPNDQYLVGQDDILEAMALAVSQNKPVLLKGETGTGKTTLVHELAHRTNNSLRQINLNGNTTVDEIVGRTIITEKGTKFLDGIMIDAMKNGYWLLLDELNAGLPEVLLALQAVLTDGKYTLVEHDGEVVVAHPNFRVFGTMNPPETYIGTNHLNPATLSRFGVTIEVEYPSAKLELEIIKSKLPSKARTSDSEISEVVRLATDIRNGYRQQEYAYMLSTRDAIAWCQINEHYGDLVKSAKYTILGKCNSDDKTALESILKVYFSAPLDVHPSDGTFAMTYKKGNLFQVCDDKCEVYNSRNYDLLGKAKSGAVFEIEKVERGTMFARLMKGNVVAIDNEPVGLSHSDSVKIGDLTQVSTRRVGQ